MGTFTFRWPHAAEEVYVTGTFDGWSKSEQLDKVGDHFEKTVTLPELAEKVYYKFVVDGRWTTDHTAPQEKDPEGNENNVLLPENLIRTTDAATQASEHQAMSNENRKVEGSSNTGEPSFAETIMSALNTVTPDSTAQPISNPLENKNHGPPGGWVETPAADGDKTFSVSPLPATDGALNPIDLKPGEKIPDSFSAQNVNNYVTLDKESYEKSDRIPGVDFSTAPVAAPIVATDAEIEFKVNPLPATEGAINPFKLAPGEKIPDDVRAADINTNVTLDKESYENSADRIPGLDAALPPVSRNMIPESSLPIISNNDVFINTVTPISTTAALAAQVPFDEPAVPEAVRESQEKAHVEPGASGIAEEVKGKAAVEDELLHKVAEAPSTSEGTAGYGTEKAETDLSLADAVSFAGNAAAAAVVGAATVAADKLPGVLESTANVAANVGSKIPGAVNATANAAVDVGSKIGQTASEAFGTAANATTNAAYAAKDTTSDVLGSAANVAASAGTKAQETAANTASTVQQTTADATSTAASSLPSVPDVVGHLPQAVQNILPASMLPASQNSQTLPTSAEVERSLAAEKASRVEGISAAVPIEVKDSIEKAGESPEAATNATAVLEKQAVEAELLREVKPTQAEPPAVAASVPSEVRDSLQQADESPEAASYPAVVAEKQAVETELLKTVKPTESIPQAFASAVPGTVKDSIKEAGKAPEAAANADVVAEKTAVEAQLLQEVKPVEVVADKRAVEAELLHEVKRTEPIGESSTNTATNGTATNGSAANGSPSNGAAANGSTAAPSQPVETPVTPTTPTDTKGLPAANGNGKATEQPTVTTGPETTTTTTVSGSASTTPERKKKNRVSGFFSKLKNKFA
ncbi:hypothetical protein QBC32DRAFT_403634 [Pseudoneurospora amorphoporcata]|uniref:AMP-activated protein kinase glycogen-binding domain-containing protein n=1 Tax=Pseudoneurospora amorphoporcata TaxID=241081 RepID=A0AAN6P3M8_9PEZI|nr:hypothetical protein QBC32DRAFT_403634 [Pseudoneurospora amorphoporcata]